MPAGGAVALGGRTVRTESRVVSADSNRCPLTRDEHPDREPQPRRFQTPIRAPPPKTPLGGGSRLWGPGMRHCCHLREVGLDDWRPCVAVGVVVATATSRTPESPTGAGRVGLSMQESTGQPGLGSFGPWYYSLMDRHGVAPGTGHPCRASRRAARHRSPTTAPGGTHQQDHGDPG